MSAAVIRADARSLPLPDASVDLIVTSPPYFGLRSYTDGGEHYAGQIGSEATPAQYVAALVECTREWVRVLKPSGSMFINLGDKYSDRGHGPDRGNGTGRGPQSAALGQTRGPLEKSLLGLPWRYALACMDDLGLILRAEIIWAKPNSLPESVQDRVRRSHEYLFHFTKQPRYYSAVDEIREPHVRASYGRISTGMSFDAIKNGVRRDDPSHLDGNPLGKLPSSVWEIAEHETLVRSILSAVSAGGLTIDEAERLITGGLAWTGPNGSRPGSSAPKAAGTGPGSLTAKDTGTTAGPVSGTGLSTASPTNSGSVPSPPGSPSTICAATADASTPPILRPSPSARTSGEAVRPPRPTASTGTSSTLLTPTSEPTGTGSAGHVCGSECEPADDVWSIPSQPLTVPARLGTDHFACVDADTEILTRRGWLRHDQLTTDDTVAGYDLDTDTARWTDCTAVSRYDYDGDLIAVESRDLSMRLTPNHRTIVQRMHTRTNRRSPVSVVRADELNARHFIPRSADWRPFGVLHVTAEGAALMGWVAAEGWYQGSCVYLSQSLDVNPQHVAEIDKLTPDAARSERKRTYKGTPWTEVTWRLSPVAAQMVQREMPGKLLPWWLTTATETARRATLNAFIDGDGHRRPDGRTGIYQKLRHNLDVLQAIAVTLGYKTTIREGGGRFVLYLTEGGRSVTLRGTSGVGSKVRREHYTGTVWCPATGTGTFIARRNGSVFVTGNSFPMELPRRIIAGWSPPGICTACGEGRRPVRGVDWSKVPHTMTEKRALTTHEAAAWCSAFADWCDAAGVSRADLDAAASTSDMGGWWMSRLVHRAAVPTPEQWAKIRAAFDPPSSFDEIVHMTRVVPVAAREMINVERAGRNRATGGGLGVSVMSITGYACACPQPDAPTRPAVVLDPFAGTGTTMLVASALGRIGVGVERSADYCKLAAWRCYDPGERAKALQVPKPPPIPDGQDALFTL